MVYFLFKVRCCWMIFLGGTTFARILQSKGRFVSFRLENLVREELYRQLLSSSCFHRFELFGGAIISRENSRRFRAENNLGVVQQYT